MANLNATLTLTGTAADLGSTLSLEVVDALLIASPTVGVSIKTATTGATVILPDSNTKRYVYIKHKGLNAAGGSSGSDKLLIESVADGVTDIIMQLEAEEFAFLPYYANESCKLQVKTTGNTAQFEYAFWTRA